jgi:hypothetical protein
MSSSLLKPNTYIKRVVSLTLALLLFVSSVVFSLFSVKTSAIVDFFMPDVTGIGFHSYLEAKKATTTEEESKRVSQSWITSVLRASFEAGNATMTAEQYKRMMEAIIKEDLPPDSIVKFEGDRLVYQYNDYDKIQIGEYVFERYHFGENINFSSASSVREESIIHIPFFIYKGDLYFESGGINFPTIGVQIFLSHGGGIGYHAMGTGGSQAITSVRYIRINKEDQFKTSMETQTLWFNGNLSTVKFDGYHFGNRLWFNASQHTRNFRMGQTHVGHFPFIPFSTIIAGDSAEFINNNLHNFTPNQTGTGVFIVPSTFTATAGMNFWEYLGTLDPNDLYTLQPPGEGTGSIQLPSIFADLCDNCEIKMWYEVHGGSNCDCGGGCEETYEFNIKVNGDKCDDPPSDVITIPPGDCCCCALNRGFFERIIAELQRIVANTSNPVSNHILWGIVSQLEQVVQELHKIFLELQKITRNTTGLDSSSGGGGSIWDFLSTLINLPAEIAKAIAAALPNINIDFAEIITALTGVPRAIIDLISENFDSILDFITSLIIPRDGFFEDTFGRMQDRIELKLPIIQVAEDFLNNFIEILSVPVTEPPTLGISGEVFGQQIEGNVLDFSPIAPFLPYIHGIIIAFAYVGFIRRLIVKIPCLFGRI